MPHRSIALVAALLCAAACTSAECDAANNAENGKVVEVWEATDE